MIQPSRKPRYVDPLRTAAREACLCAASAVARCEDRRQPYGEIAIETDSGASVPVPCRLTFRRHRDADVSPSSNIEFLVEEKLAALGARSSCNRLDWCDANLGDAHRGVHAQLTEEVF